MLRFLIMGSMFFLVGCQKNMEPANFAHLKLPSTPNYYYVAPEGTQPTPNEVSPVYAMTKKQLAQKWTQAIILEPRVKLIHEDWGALRFSYIQRTFFFRFPDQIDIEFIEVQENKSSFYLISRSHYGYSDLGKNKKRIQSWLKKWSPEA